MPSISIILRSNNLLKVSACLTAYLFWSMMSDVYIIDFSCTVPVGIQTAPSMLARQTHDSVTITIRGLRKHIRSLQRSSLSACINLEQTPPGKHAVAITRAHFSLPPAVALVNCVPSTCPVLLEKVT